MGFGIRFTQLVVSQIHSTSLLMHGEMLCKMLTIFFLKARCERFTFACHCKVRPLGLGGAGSVVF